MHIPDGFLDPRTWVSASILSAGGLAYSVKKTGETLGERQVPAMGVMAAFIFAAQMVNFPIAGGTSGHLLGAALATVLLGPWCAAIIITTVLIIQCLFFQDGGVTALGANVLNMAIIGPLVAAGIYSSITRFAGDKKGANAGVFLAALASVVVAAVFAALELAFSGTVPFKVVFPAMIGWHVLIGIGEGLITVAVVSFVRSIGFGVDWQKRIQKES